MQLADTLTLNELEMGEQNVELILKAKFEFNIRREYALL